MIHFFHGLVGDHRHFSQVVAHLGPQLGVCKVPAIPFLESNFDDIVAGLPKGSLRSSVRVGNSIGCSLALKSAGPSDQLILTAPPFDYSRGAVPLRKALINDWIKALYVQHGNIKGEAAFVANATAQVQALLASPTQIKRLRQYKAQAKAFWEDPLLKTHQDRITFVVGKQDFTTPVDDFVTCVRAKLPRASVEVWDACGHAVPLDAPRQLAALIRHRAMCLEERRQSFALSA
jgi:pimeloyl-ACP methyl ester carboxylesterase